MGGSEKRKKKKKTKKKTKTLHWPPGTKHRSQGGGKLKKLSIFTQGKSGRPKKKGGGRFGKRIKRKEKGCEGERIEREITGGGPCKAKRNSENKKIDPYLSKNNRRQKRGSQRKRGKGNSES